MTSTISQPQFGISLAALVRSGTVAAPTQSTVNDATSQALKAGTASANVAYCYSGTLTVGTGTSLLDLHSLNDPLSNAINFAQVGALKVTNSSTNTTNLTIGGGGNAFVPASMPIQGGSNGAGTLFVNFPMERTTTSQNNLLLQSDTANTPVTVTIFGR